MRSMPGQVGPDVTLETLHGDLTNLQADMRDVKDDLREVKGDLREVKALVASGFRTFADWPAEVLRLLRENFGPGDRIVEISPFAQPYVYGLAVITRTGVRRLLLVNKRNRDVSISVAGAAGSQVESVDVTTGFKPPWKAKLSSDGLILHGFAVSLITLP